MNRKRRSLAFVLATALTSCAFAAVPPGAQCRAFHAGGRVGLNLAKLAVDDLPSPIENRWRSGLRAGPAVSFAPESWGFLSIHGAVLFGMHGGVQEYDAQGVIGDSTVVAHEEDSYELTYLDIPLLARFSVPSGAASPYFEVGPELGILLDAEVEAVASAPGFPSETQTVDLEPETEPVDLRVLFAAGVEFPLGPLYGFGEVGFALGVLDIAKTSDTKVSNRALSLSVGLAY